MFVGIMTHLVYGTSGNELPPPVKDRIRTAELIDVDTIKEARRLMAEKVKPLRLAASKTREEYSSSDGYDWEVIELTNGV